MNDEQQHEAKAAEAASAPPAHAAQPPPRKAKPQPKPFDAIRSVPDEKAFCAPKPECAKTVLAFGFEGGHFVPVSFVAKDWNVTPRRIRALLAAGRLAGRLQENGYWEVRFPYSFTFGTRGPGLKRQQRPAAKPKNPELRAV